MWKHPRLSSLVLAAAILACSLICAASGAEEHDNRKEAARWRWPEEHANPLRSGAGRLIPSHRQPALARVIQDNTKTRARPANAGFLTNPNPVPGPAPGLSLVRPTPTTRTPAVSTKSTTPAAPQVAQPVATTTTAAAAATEQSTVGESSTAASATKNNSVPLLKDAGKPGNPYILLNDIFPPKNFIRTKEEEAANLNSLKHKDIGNLDAKEVWLADDDLFVVRGFNFKKPYTADPSGPPISDYEAPAPNPPPPPEPGTVFYPTNQTDDHQGPLPFLPPDFNNSNPGSLPFFPFVPGGLNDSNRPPVDFQNFAPPFPFLPPPPPHWTEEKEFNNNELLGAGPGAENFPFSQGQGLPPPSGLNGFPNFPQFPGAIPQNGQFGQQQQPPPGFPPAGVPPFGQGGFPPGPQGFPPNGAPNGQGFPPRPAPPQGFPPNGAAPPGGPSSGGAAELPEVAGAPEGNVTIVVDEDDEVPFTPLFPERPVEYYYPTHNTTAQPPGPFGPGIFVPPPATFFAPRNESDVIDVKIPQKLFRPPFNLPNYYDNSPWRPLIPQHHRPNDGPAHAKRPENVPAPVRNPAPIQTIAAHHIPSAGGLANPAHIKVVPGPKPILLDNQFKEVEKLPQLSQLPQIPLFQSHASPAELEQITPPVKQTQTHQTNHQSYPTFPSAYDFIKNQYHAKQPVANYGGGGGGSQYSSTPVSLESDTDVNHKFPRPTVDPDSEIIDPSSLFQPNPAWSPYSFQRPAASPYSVAQLQFGQLRQQPTIGHRVTSAAAATAQSQSAASYSDASKKPVNYVRVYGAGGSYSYPVGKKR